MDLSDIHLENIARNLVLSRTACGKSLKSCADILGISGAKYRKYENGELIPTLPELETLSFFLHVPFSSLLADEKSRSDATAQRIDPDNINHLLQIRNSVIGTLLQIEREKKGSTYKEISEQCDIPINRLKRYESGLQGIPLPELLKIARSLSIDPGIFFDENSPLSSWQDEQSRIASFKDIPDELKDFISDTSNRPYLILAQNLKAMNKADLEAMAEAFRVIMEKQSTIQSLQVDEEHE